MVPVGIPRKNDKFSGTSEVDELEKIALEKANKALSTIENAIAIWEASEQKPLELKGRIERLRYFHDALANWEKNMLISFADSQEAEERMDRLREFSNICYSYARG